MIDTNNIKDFVDNIEINRLKKDYIDNKVIFEIVGDFIKKYKLILYGGYALNLILPDNKKIYKSYTQADFDCYSYDAKKHAIILANILKKKKYKLIKLKLAKHENTFKLYIGTLNVLDITQIDKEIFYILIDIHKYEKYNDKIKYYKDNYNIVPLYLLKRNMHYELARPEGSYFRWEKVKIRLDILNEVYFKKKINKKKENYIKIPDDWNNCINLILNYIKNNKHPIIDNYAIKFLLNIKDKNCCRINKFSNFLVILSKNYIKTTNQLMKIIKNNIDIKKYNIIKLNKNIDTSIDILSDRIRIVIENKITKERISLISIIKVSGNCYSTKTINGFTIGSIDTILCFLYSYYLTYLITKYIKYRHNTVLEDTQEYIDLYENIINKIFLKERLSVECYGKEITNNDIYKKNWDKKLSILKIN
jgi:hypothetical protein